MAAGSVVALLRNPQKKRCVYDFIPCYICCVFCLLVGLSCLIVLSHHTCAYCVSCFLYLGTWYLLYSGSTTLHHSIIGNVNVKSFSDITGQWLTMEAIFTTTQPMLTRKNVYLYAYDCQEYCRIHVQWLTVFFVSQSHDHLLVAINMPVRTTTGLREPFKSRLNLAATDLLVDLLFLSS